MHYHGQTDLGHFLQILDSTLLDATCGSWAQRLAAWPRMTEWLTVNVAWIERLAKIREPFPRIFAVRSIQATLAQTKPRHSGI